MTDFFTYHSQRCSQGHKLKAKASNLKAKAWTFEANANAKGAEGMAKAFEQARAKIKTGSTSDNMTE